MTATSSQSTEGFDFVADLLPSAGAQLWNGPAPQSLRDHYHTADNDEGWQRWKKHLARRRKPGPLTKARFTGRPEEAVALSAREGPGNGAVAGGEKVMVCAWGDEKWA